MGPVLLLIPLAFNIRYSWMTLQFSIALTDTGRQASWQAEGGVSTRMRWSRPWAHIESLLVRSLNATSGLRANCNNPVFGFQDRAKMPRQAMAIIASH